MELKKRIIPADKTGEPFADFKEREYIFFTVRYNHHRDLCLSSANELLDKEDWRECQCVLCLPESYDPQGEETPLILACHGAGRVVDHQRNQVGGVQYVQDCLDHGYAALDVCGSEENGLSMGCPAHIFALHKAYLYAVRHYNLSKRVLVAGASMGGQTAMNFANNFPGLVTAIGLYYPRLHMEGMTVDGHYCIGSWDKEVRAADGLTQKERIGKVYHFPDVYQWHEETTIGFNPHRSRSFINSDGERVVFTPCPVKIWQGLADVVVDPVMVEEYVKCVRRSGSYIELRKLDGIDHSQNDVMHRELTMWFNRFI